MKFSKQHNETTNSRSTVARVCLGVLLSFVAMLFFCLIFVVVEKFTGYCPAFIKGITKMLFSRDIKVLQWWLWFCAFERISKMKIDKKRFEKIYEKIASDKKISVEQVKREMQLSLDVAWDSNNENLRNLFPKGKPTLEEFLIGLKGEVSKDDAY